MMPGCKRAPSRFAEYARLVLAYSPQQWQESELTLLWQARWFYRDGAAQLRRRSRPGKNTRTLQVLSSLGSGAVRPEGQRRTEGCRVSRLRSDERLCRMGGR
jgi:hypothetical protein